MKTTLMTLLCAAAVALSATAQNSVWNYTALSEAPATNACEIADTGIQVLSAAWTPTATDTLTVLFDGTNFLELARSDND